MATTIKPVLSSKNRYHISKHRYYELKHFCLQYPEWKRILSEIEHSQGPRGARWGNVRVDNGRISDPVGDSAVLLSEYGRYTKMVETAAAEADFGLRTYILKAVTEGVSFNYLKATCGVPCERDTFYDRYRKFFWILNRLR